MLLIRQWLLVFHVAPPPQRISPKIKNQLGWGRGGVCVRRAHVAVASEEVRVSSLRVAPLSESESSPWWSERSSAPATAVFPKVAVMSRKNEVPHDGRDPTRGSSRVFPKKRSNQNFIEKKIKIKIKKVSGSAKDFIESGRLPLCPSPTVSPSARRPPGTSVCPSSRLWACGGVGHRRRCCCRYAGGASCEQRRWRRRGRGVFVSPSPSP